MTTLDDRAVGALRALVTEPLPGDVLDGRFELKEPIGEGGMGLVYAAWDRKAAREVAVKIAMSVDAETAARMEREADALAEITHPALVRCVARGRAGDARFFAMERLVGISLADLLAKRALTAGETAAMGRVLAEALAAVHAKGIVHRDVKPTNVFLEDEDPARARLLDFGIARVLSLPALTKTGALVGTPGYMAPEQVRGKSDVSGRADVFALGCVLYECLSARPAFSANDTVTLLAKIVLEDAPPLAASPLAALVRRMLAKDAEDRPDAAEVARALAALEGAREGAPAGEIAPGLVAGAVVAGKYEIGERIGEGGMGIVVSARHKDLDIPVALKVLRRSSDEARLLREAKAAARLESEHVSRVLDVGRLADGAPYIVMEFLKGTDLGQRLRDRGPLSVADAATFVLEALDAIAEAHALGIVHRDVKPQNLFLVGRRDGTETVKVLDFGISKLIQAEGTQPSSLTGTDAVVGSAYYMSPEQIANARSVDARTDIWALGVVLYELVSSNRPFEGQGPVAVGAKIAAALPSPLRGAPPELERVILRCLEKEPARRYADVAELAAELAPFARPEARGYVTRIARTLGRKTPEPRRRRSPLAIALGATAFGALSAALVVAATRSARPEPVAPEPSAVAMPSAAPPPPPAVDSAIASAPVQSVAPPPPPPPRPRKAAPRASTPAAPPPPSGAVDVRDKALEAR